VQKIERDEENQFATFISEHASAGLLTSVRRCAGVKSVEDRHTETTTPPRFIPVKEIAYRVCAEEPLDALYRNLERSKTWR